MNANLERKYLYMELDRKEMGRRISKRRKVLGIKQAVLAEKIGVNGNHLSSVETGKVTPSLELFVKICDELGVICLRVRCTRIMCLRVS